MGWGPAARRVPRLRRIHRTPLLGWMLDDARHHRGRRATEKLVVMGRRSARSSRSGGQQVPRHRGSDPESSIADALERILLRVHPAEFGASADDWAAMERRIDHRAKIGGYTGPTLLLHTRFDGMVDVSHAHRLAEWAGGEKRLRVFDSGDHNSILWNNFDEYMSEIATFLARVRTGRPA